MAFCIERALVHDFTSLTGFTLDVLHQARNILGCAGSALGQIAYLISYHGKATTCFTGACGFNRGIEGQQVGLAGYFLNQLYKAADFFGPLTQAANLLGCSVHQLEGGLQVLGNSLESGTAGIGLLGSPEG